MPAAGEVSSVAEAKKSHRCFYCNEAFSNDLERVLHIEDTHPGNLYYPTPEDFENRLRPN